MNILLQGKNTIYNMKHLQLYEKNFTVNSLKKFAKEKDELYELIREYSIINKIYDFDNVKHTVVDFYYEYNVSKIGDEVIVVSTFVDTISISEQREDLYYTISNLDDLNRFIENPKVYKSSNKYNL